MAQVTGTLTDSAGNVLAGVPVGIYTSGTLNLASLYYDAGFTKPRFNPVYTNASGVYGSAVDPVYINATTFDVVYFVQKLQGMELTPGSGPVSDTGGSLPPSEWAFAWTAGGAVTTSYASLFTDVARTVVAGQKFLVAVDSTITNGGTAGFVKVGLQVAAGDTAVVAFDALAGSINPVIFMQENIGINAVMAHPFTAIMTVITGGTLTLSVFGQCSGAAGTIAANGAVVYVRRLT